MTSPPHDLAAPALDLVPRHPPARSLVEIAWQRKFLLALGVLGGLALGALYYLVSPPTYSSTAQVLVVKKRPDPPGADARPGAFEDFVSTQQALLKSPLVAEQAIQKRQLAALKSFAEETEPLTDVLVKRLSVTRTRDPAAGPTPVFTLTFRARQADDCNTVLQALIDSYSEMLDQTYLKGSDDTIELISRARNVLRQELAQKDAAYREFRLKAPLFWKGAEWINSRQERLSSIESKRTALLLRRAEVQGQLESLETALKDGRSRAAVLALVASLAGKVDTDGAAAGRTSALQDQLHALLLQEAQLREKFGANAEELQSVRKRIDLTRNLLAQPAAAWESQTAGHSEETATADPVQGCLQALRQELDHLQTTEKLLTRLFEQEHDEAKKLSSYEIQDEAFRADLARSQALYDGIIKRLQDVNLAKEFGGYEARVIAPPGSGGVKRVEPSPLLALSAGVLLSILGACGLAGLGELLDQRLGTPEEVSRQLGLPVLGQVPRAGRNPRSTRTVASGACALDPLLGVYYQPGSREAEAYRGVRTSLFVRTRDRGPQVLQVTAPQPGDGTTTLAANLAISLAQSGKRVVLIDANFHEPCLHQLFGVRAGPGLAAVLTGAARVEDAVRPTAIDGLGLLPCDSDPCAAAELLFSPRLEKLLATLRAENDLVLLDTPPVRTGADSTAVAARVDGVLLVVHVSRTPRPEAQRARDLLATVGASVLGVVVNGVRQFEGYHGLISEYHRPTSPAVNGSVARS
jgi:capsular exopolysaccharide synthesis family protein